MSSDIKRFLEFESKDGFVSIFTCKEAAQKYPYSYKEVEQEAMEAGLCPLRYKRNQSTISLLEQKKLFESHVAIIGCGGLGGHVAENLCRIGVGKLSLFDYDVFEEHNLNRQNFCSLESIGQKKVHVVKEACKNINPALAVKAYQRKFDPKRDFELIKDVDIVIDALDNPQTKLELSFTCKERNKDFIHGAIAGFSAQHTSCNTLEKLYKDGEKGIEQEIGNPSFTVTYAAALQSAECIKLLLQKGETFKGKLFMSDILNNEFIFL